MQALQARRDRVPIERFRWRDRAGDFHYLDEMETRHLFHVIRMIWDHSMPLEAQTHFRRRYVFSSFYTRDYMIDALRLGFPHLMARADIEPWMQVCLDQMATYLRSGRAEIPAPLLKLGAPANV